MIQHPSPAPPLPLPFPSPSPPLPLPLLPLPLLPPHNPLFPVGTDATHAEHIETIKTRNYVGVQSDGGFIPGELGMGLVDGMYVYTGAVLESE